MGEDRDDVPDLYRLARGRPSVTVVANGGAITLDEVDQNVKQSRPMIVGGKPPPH